MLACGHRRTRVAVATTIGLATLLSSGSMAQVPPKPAIPPDKLATAVDATAAGSLAPVAVDVAEPARCARDAITAALHNKQIPNVVGCEIKSAVSGFQLADHPAEPEAVAGSPPAGLIVSQSPNAGEQVTQPIVLRYSDGTVVPAPAEANLYVTVALAGDSFRRGSTAVFEVTVGNKGPAVATNIQLRGSLENLVLDRVDGPCDALPCRIASLAPGAAVVLRATTAVAGVGDLRASFTVKGEQTDPEPANDTVSTSAAIWEPPECTTLSCRHPEWPWWLLIPAIPLAIGAPLMIQRWRRAKWRRRVRVTVWVGPGQGRAGPLAMAAPPISIRIRVEPGEAQPGGPIPIRKAV